MCKQHQFVNTGSIKTIATQCSKQHFKEYALVYILEYGKSCPNYYFAFTGL